jgi:ATP-dependent Lhr-like helicase
MNSTTVLFDQPGSAEEGLALLPAPLADWFGQRLGTPTPVQRLAWSALARHPHLLLSAPTGTGKTLAAFLPVLADLLFTSHGTGWQPVLPPEGRTGCQPVLPAAWSDSPLRVLYVAPLKALAADAVRNLHTHLADLAGFLPPAATLRVALRTGDTPARERKRLRDEPPDILLTTPESLAVLLSQPGHAALWANLRWLLVDEVHALAGNKRGADLAVSLERLAFLTAGDPRRVGLSATATPLTEAAHFLVGPQRPCAIVRAPEREPPRITLSPLPEGQGLVRALVDRLLPELGAWRASLIFTNTRGLAERLAWALRRRLGEATEPPVRAEEVAVHHSALAAGRRREVEEAFKAGRLRVVVSSTSLELGIDMGPIDQVVLVHPPGDVIRLLQRIGRAGHGPGRIQHGLVLTASPAELLEATVTAASGVARECEPLRLARSPLDVLCQQILGMTSASPWEPGALFDLVRRSAPFAGLARQDLDDCLAYLRGLDRDQQAWLPPRLREDGDCFRILDARTARLLRRNLGTILAEQTVPVALRQYSDDPDALEDPPPLPIGEVDEGFAERLQPGDRFLLDGRCLEYRGTHEGSLLVEQVVGRPRVPRWGGEGWPLSSELARRLFVLRVRAAEALRDGVSALEGLLRGDYGLGGQAVSILADYFQRQETLSEIPDTTSLLVEGVANDQGITLSLHTPLNRLGNDGLARVAVRRLARDHGLSVGSIVADLGFSLRFRRLDATDVPGLIRGVLTSDTFDADLDAALSDSPAFRERFSRVAQTGFMLLRNPAGRRRRVGGTTWAPRELFEQVRGRDPDFVLLRQAMREVRADLCDAPAARDYCVGLPGLGVRCRWLGRPSPFVEAWTQPEAEVVTTPESSAEALRRLHAALMEGGPDAGAD